MGMGNFFETITVLQYRLEAAVAKEHSHAITIRDQWFEIFE